MTTWRQDSDWDWPRRKLLARPDGDWATHRPIGRLPWWRRWLGGQPRVERARVEWAWRHYLFVLARNLIRKVVPTHRLREGMHFGITRQAASLHDRNPATEAPTGLLHRGD
jgi:hypothetical protein